MIRSVTIIGAGNVAYHFTKIFKASGIQVNRVYARNNASAKIFQKAFNIEIVTEINQVDKNADLYLLALKDDALMEVSSKLDNLIHDKIFVHTSGATKLFNHLKNNRSGVIYPLQTFSISKNIAWENLPVYIESDNKTDYASLESLMQKCSRNIKSADSSQRAAIHLAAVFSCNFSNYLYFISKTLMDESQLDFKDLLPLIKETTEKLEMLNPAEAQTGPAVRGDFETINRHLMMLKKHQNWESLYQEFSKLIAEDIKLKSHVKT